jgi:hypothetical protein
MACNEDIKLIASKKQTIIPGIKTAKPYTTYLFKIALKNTVAIQIDSVIISNTNRCLKVNHFVSRNKEKLVMTLTAAVQEGNFTEIPNCPSTIEKVQIHYKLNNKSKVLNVTTFEEETVTRR